MSPAHASRTIPLLLRTGFALCFVGHGVFGVMTKAAWVPYFGVVGIPESAAWVLMPWIGGMDIALGFLAFLWPCRALFAWGAAWCVWTALLRPLADQGWPEFFERAGNYGVPLAALALVGLRGAWLARLDHPWPHQDESAARGRMAWVLRLTTATLLLGHAGCALLLHKPALAHHYTAIVATEDAVRAMHVVGWCEVVFALAVVARPFPAMLIGIGGWKLATEMLFLTSGTAAPLFEVIERGGSYLAPLTLAVLLLQGASQPVARPFRPAPAI